ncbi:hypothetical protein D3C85_900650 [compost metagenome]
MAARRAGDLHRRGGGDTAVAAAGHHFPVAAYIAANLHHGYAVGVDFLAHFLCADALAVHQRRAIGVQQRGVDVLVVEHQQAVVRTLARAAAAIDGEEVHAVMVHADLFGLVLGAVAGVIEEGRVAPGDRGAPGNEGGGLVARRHGDGVGAAGGNGIEGQARAGLEGEALGLGFGRQGFARDGGAEEGEGAHGGAADQQLAAIQPADQVDDVRVVGGVAGEFVAVAKEHGILVLLIQGGSPCRRVDGDLTLMVEGDGTVTGGWRCCCAGAGAASAQWCARACSACLMAKISAPPSSCWITRSRSVLASTRQP